MLEHVDAQQAIEVWQIVAGRHVNAVKLDAVAFAFLA